ncbi:MAG: SpoIID/LytB domain-containing protein [Calditrichaeota bacterium]|nr:SpoIID/LytB domain-containing protein [Calditrichota bacterium]
MAGKQIDPHAYHQKSPVLIRGFFHLPWRTAVLVFWVGWILSCAPTLHKPPSPRVVAPPVEPEIRVCLTDRPATTSLQFLTPYRLQLEEAEYILDRRIGILQVQLSADRVVLRNDKRYFSLPAPARLVFVPDGGTGQFEWNGRVYPGVFSIRLDHSGSYVINQLPLEEYLKGVIPFEMPTGQAEYQEALLAQAVAARTYALYRLRQEPRHPAFHLYADVRDQVYGGLEKVNDRVLEALRRTRGQVLTRSEQVAHVQYHSTCGGYLENYLEPPDSSADLWADRAEDGDNCRISPIYRWIERRDVGTVLQNLQRLGRIDEQDREAWRQQGFAFRLRVNERTTTGRVQSLYIQVADREFTIQGYAIRRVLADSSGRALPSNFFLLVTSPTLPEQFYIIGAGFGHGRGMCQWGALGMALSGANYREILRFYFPAYELKKVYQ